MTSSSIGVLTISRIICVISICVMIIRTDLLVTISGNTFVF